MSNNKVLLKFYNPKEELVSLLTYYSTRNKGALFSFNKEDAGGNNLMLQSIEKIKQICPRISNSLNVKYSITEGTSHLFKRFESISYENKLKARLNKIQEEIDELKRCKCEKYEELNVLDKKKDNAKLDIEIFKHVEKYKIKSFCEDEFEKVHLYTNENEIRRGNHHRRTLTEEKQDENFVKFTLGSKYAKLRKNKCETATASLISIEQQSIEVREEIEYIKQRLLSLQEISNGIKDELLLHYHRLLKEGIDTRSEGLSWIIKEIYHLGKKVIISYLPDFLDEKGIQFLFNYSKISIEIEEIERDINELRGVCGPYLKSEKETLQQTKKDIFINTHIKNNRSTEIYPRIGNKSSLFRLSNKESYKLNKIFLDKNFVEHLEQFTLLTTLKKELISTMQNIKRNESKRIFTEFMKNNYQRRYQVTKKKVLSALLGEDSISPEMYSQTREAKKYFDTIKNIELYKTGAESKKSNVHLNNIFKSFLKK